MVGFTHTSSTESNHEASPSDTEGNPTCVIRLRRSDVTRDLGIVQTLSTVTGEGNIAVAEDVVNELVHRGLLESTSSTSLTAESSGTLNFLGQEIADICMESGRCLQLWVQR